ncbi:uncharacterized protein LOC134559716 [Prinia subflava]|uniref:uncharacterized protein LOC134559716 n=1 Tax=Prinia subflava TaxID=208062 RepID=UPI002FE0F8C6
MVWAAPALAATTLCLRVCTDPVKATAAALILGAVLAGAEHPRGVFLPPLASSPVCALEPGSIPAADPGITLGKLKLCPALAGAQRGPLNALLLSGGTGHGHPSSWDSHTLRDLGPLLLALNQSTLGLVAEVRSRLGGGDMSSRQVSSEPGGPRILSPSAAREDFRRSIAAAYISQGHSQRENSLLLLRALAASASPRARLRRSSARCQSKPITASNIADTVPFLSPEELDLCLSRDVLIKNLEAVLELPLTSEAMWVLKKKVDEVRGDTGQERGQDTLWEQGSVDKGMRVPEGSFFSLSEEQLRRLGPLSCLYTEQEISQWRVTTSDTLLALLSPSGGQCGDAWEQQLLSSSLTGPLLQEMGGEQLCKLQEEQIQQIPAAAIGTAGLLNISSCSQTKKEQLYGKAREAFASLASSPGCYYCALRPYLGGAPAEDLKDLADAGDINMDLDTFLTLNPQEFQKLSVTDVKNLLGKNLAELKRAENEPWVQSWVQRQPQWELDCVLGIDLQGGLPAPTGTASPAGATTLASVTSRVTVTTPVPTIPVGVTSPVPTTLASVTSPVPTTLATVTSRVTVTSPVSTTPASVTSRVTATTPVPTTPATVTVTTPVPTTPASATSTGTVPTSPHPATSANVTPVSTTSVNVTSMATNPVPTTLPTVPTTPSSVTSTGTVPTSPHPSPSVTVTTSTASSSHSTPQPSTCHPQCPSHCDHRSPLLHPPGCHHTQSHLPRSAPGPAGTEPSPGGTEPSPGGTEPSPGGGPEPPASNGNINLRPPEHGERRLRDRESLGRDGEGSGSRLSSCLLPVLAAALGTLLLQGLP